MSETASKNATVTHILLPTCTESKFDIFLYILKCYVTHAKLNGDHLTEAFMSGMKGESFAVETDDLTLSWMQLKSGEEEIRQFKLLGFWAIDNFPSLCTKMLPKKYQALPRNGARVIGNTEMNAENIDEIIFSKMKLRVIELRVKPSTLAKLNNFVTVQGWVGAKRCDEITISKQMVSFDVDTDFVESCWEALRCGKFSMTADAEQQDNTVMYSFVTTTIGEIGDSDDSEEDRTTTSQSKRFCRRPCIEMTTRSVLERESVSAMSVENNEGGSNIDCQMVSGTGLSPLQKRHYHVRDRRIDCGMRAEEMDNDVNIGSLQAIILRLREDIGTLSKSIQDKKDDEMAKLKRANENLTANQMDLEQKIEGKTTLIIALQKGIDANMSLNEKYKSDIAACLGSNDLLKIEIERLSSKLAEAVTSKQKLEDELASIKIKSDSVVVELRMELNANMNLKDDLAASVESNKQLKMEMELIGRKLVEAENEIVSNKVELQQLNDVNINLNGDLQRCLNSNGQLKIEVERLCQRLLEADKTIASDLSVKNQLVFLKSKGESVVAELRSEIECLAKVTYESVKENEQLKLELKKQAELIKSDASTQAGENEMTAESNNDLPSDDVASFVCLASADLNGIDNQKKESESGTEFQMNDPMVENCRKSLHGLEFGWLKFPNFKNGKFTPGFIHPPDKDGKRRAQWILVSGCLSSKKREYVEFDDNLPEDQKDSSEVLALEKFNKKFLFNCK